MRHAPMNTCEQTGEPYRSQGGTHDDPGDTQSCGSGGMWISLDSVCIEHIEASLPFYAHV